MAIKQPARIHALGTFLTDQGVLNAIEVRGFDITNLVRVGIGSYLLRLDQAIAQGSAVPICQVRDAGAEFTSETDIVNAGADVQVLIRDGAGAAADPTTLEIVVFGYTYDQQ